MSDVFETDVPALLGGVRVDRVVAMLTEVSRAQAAALVDGGQVEVDGAVVSVPSAPLRAGSRLRVVLPEVPTVAVSPDAGVDVPVVHADAAVIVVDKPAGLVVHPGAGHAAHTMVSGLLARFPDLAALGPLSDPRRPGIVHRLDRGTSGLLVVARTAEAYRSLVAQLAARTVTRRYLALVSGHLASDRGVVDAPIGRSARTPTKMAVSAEGRTARTAYRVLRRLDEPLAATLVAVALETGRTHQIRVHLSAIGHPVVGDDRYGRGGRVGGRALPAGRLFLHAARLGFTHPQSGEAVSWWSPLPADLAGLSGPVGEIQE